MIDLAYRGCTLFATRNIRVSATQQRILIICTCASLATYVSLSHDSRQMFLWRRGADIFFKRRTFVRCNHLLSVFHVMPRLCLDGGKRFPSCSCPFYIDKRSLHNYPISTRFVSPGGSSAPVRKKIAPHRNGVGPCGSGITPWPNEMLSARKRCITIKPEPTMVRLDKNIYSAFDRGAVFISTMPKAGSFASCEPY